MGSHFGLVASSSTYLFIFCRGSILPTHKYSEGRRTELTNSIKEIIQSILWGNLEGKVESLVEVVGEGGWGGPHLSSPISNKPGTSLSQCKTGRKSHLY